MCRLYCMQANSQFLIIPAFLFLLSSCTQEDLELRTCTAPTMDGHTYEVIRIGEQCWFAENLKTTEFSDGTPIPVVEPNALRDMQVPGRVVDPNLPDHYNTFYNGWTLLTPKGVCPEGWRVPTANEYTQLHRYTRSMSTAEFSNVTGAEFCDPDDWDLSITDVEFNTFGFSAQPAGIIDTAQEASTWHQNTTAYFWTRFDRLMPGPITKIPMVFINEEHFHEACASLEPEFGLCLRCILDE